jgi:phage gp37-like protein
MARSVIEWEGSKEGNNDGKYGGHWAVVATAATSRVAVKLRTPERLRFNGVERYRVGGQQGGRR